MTIVNWTELTGPWNHEPAGDDYELFRDEATGWMCAVHRTHMGSWCGYAYVPATIRPQDVEVHGGVTWTAEYLPDESCEMGEAGQWLGFDCADAGDLIPALQHPEWMPETYKTYEYAKAECSTLCSSARRQLDAELN